MFISRSVDLIKVAMNPIHLAPTWEEGIALAKLLGLPEPQNAMQMRAIYKDLAAGKYGAPIKMREKINQLQAETKTLTDKLSNANKQLDAAQRQLGEYATKRSKFFSHLGDVIKTHPYAAGGLGAGMLGAGALATYLAHRAGKKKK